VPVNSGLSIQHSRGHPPVVVQQELQAPSAAPMHAAAALSAAPMHVLAAASAASMAELYAEVASCTHELPAPPRQAMNVLLAEAWHDMWLASHAATALE
jgi:hypothetical protein